MKDPKGPVKAYKSPEELAKKHKVPLDKIIAQVKMGTKVEGEHTTSKNAAKITALQHVDELPDYYTKLKKVEKIKEGNLHSWFSNSKSKEGKPGWVNVVTGDSCASDKPGEGVPKCVSSSKRASMTPTERRSAAARKKQQILINKKNQVLQNQLMFPQINQRKWKKNLCLKKTKREKVVVKKMLVIIK